MFGVRLAPMRQHFCGRSQRQLWGPKKIIFGVKSADDKKSPIKYVCVCVCGCVWLCGCVVMCGCVWLCVCCVVVCVVVWLCVFVRAYGSAH